jgi:hypothetical protein
MTIHQRRFFMFFFIFLFIIIAPVIVFFAKGYRFDIKTKIFVYSGSITMKSIPRNIKVFLNDKQQNEKRLNYINNAYTINGVRPGKYSLRLEKDNYTSWEKDIEVHSGISTEFWNILLFPNKEAQEVLSHTDKNIKQFFLSPRDEQELIFFSEEDDKRAVYLLDAKSNNVDKIFETDKFYFLNSSEEENVEWSSDNKHIFIPFQDEKGVKTYIIAKIKDEEIEDPINLNEIFNVEENDDEIIIPSKLTEKQTEADNEGESITFKKVRWMFDKTDELVILTDNHELYYLDFNKPEEKILIDDQVSSFDFAGNRIYYAQLPNNLIWEIKDSNIETKRQITNRSFTPSEDGFTELTVYDEYRLTIKNELNGNLLIFNEEKEENEVLTKIIESDVNGVQFSDDGKKLLYWSDSEVWFLMLRDWEVQPVRKKGDNELITRFSTPIKNVQWLDNYENILFSSGNKIKSAEIDVRNHVNIVDVFESSQDFDNRDFFYNKKNQTLFLRSPEKINDKEISTLKSIILLESSGIFGFGG